MTTAATLTSLQGGPLLTAAAYHAAAMHCTRQQMSSELAISSVNHMVC